MVTTLRPSLGCRIMGLASWAPGGVFIWLIPLFAPAFGPADFDYWWSVGAITMIGLITWRVLRIKTVIDGSRLTVYNPWRTTIIRVTRSTTLERTQGGFFWTKGVESTGVEVVDGNRRIPILASHYADDEMVAQWHSAMERLRASTGCATSVPTRWDWRTRNRLPS
jgi:hypothetical protein